MILPNAVLFILQDNKPHVVRMQGIPGDYKLWYVDRKMVYDELEAERLARDIRKQLEPETEDGL